MINCESLSPPARRTGRQPKRTLLSALITLGLATAALQPTTLHADEALDAARKRYEVGERHYVEGRYWQAAKAFEEAYNLSKRGDLLFNAARAYDRGEYSVRAIEAYAGYLSSVPDAPDRGQIEKRLADLRASLSKLMIVTSEKAYIYADGHEIGRTPMSVPLEMDSGYHRILVRKDNLTWSREQQFNAGDTYRFEVTLSDRPNESGGLDSGTEVEGERLRTPCKRFAALVGVGGAVDIVGGGFPPSQVAFVLGLDYRGLRRSGYALDIMMRVPFELASGWRNAGFLIGGRGVYFPSAKIPIELFVELGAGLGVLESTVKRQPDTKGACSTAAALNPCSLYGVRVRPVVGAAYRIVPAFEVRLEALGVDLNFTSPVVDPRLSFMAVAAYRFL